MVDVQVNKASPSNFELVFPKIPTESTISASEELTLNIFGSIIPGLTIESTELNWQGGLSQNSGKTAFEPWSVDFVVDSQFANWKMIYNWITYINNNKDKYSELPKNYKVDATLKITDNFQSEILRIFFIDIWVQSLNEVSLSHRESESYLECNVNFAYDRYEVRSW
jgi:hypothetical protein